MGPLAEGKQRALRNPNEEKEQGQQAIHDFDILVINGGQPIKQTGVSIRSDETDIVFLSG